MTDAINTQNRLQSTAIRTEIQSNARNGSGQVSNNGDNPTVKPGTADIVKLSSSNVLHDLNACVRELTEVNSARVESIKLALAKGSYQPNAEVIAKKFIEIEKILP